MSFEALYKKAQVAAIGAQERLAAQILIVEPESGVRLTMRTALGSLGFGTIVEASDHQNALLKLEQRPFTHLIFDAKKSNFKAREFLRKVFDFTPQIIAIASSSEPTVDDVFDLLIQGARGYLVKPFTEEGLDDSIVNATKGEAISDTILYAKNRNEALAALILNSLDKLAVVMRQSQQFETAKAELPRRRASLKRSTHLGATFALGGPDCLIESMVDGAIERANGPASRLGRIRQRLVGKKQELERSEAPPDESLPS